MREAPNDHTAYLIVDHFEIDPDTLTTTTTLAQLGADDEDLADLAETIGSEFDCTITLVPGDTWLSINTKLEPA